MASNGWRYIASRLNGDGTETFLHMDVPLTDVDVSDSLSAPGSINATISPEIATLKDNVGDPLFLEWSTALYAEKDGDIRAGAIVSHCNFEGPQWGLESTGFVGYSKDMPYTGSGQYWVKTDTLDIYRAIWAHIQSNSGSDIGLTFDQRKSGLLVGSELHSEQYDPEGGSGGLTLQSQAYKLAYYQDHDLQSNLDSLASETPFDYRERHQWSADGTITHRIDFGVPTLGRRRNDLRFALGENIFEIPAVTRAGEDYASEVYFLGAGEGARTIRGHATAPRGRLRRVAIRTDSSVRRTDQANHLAAADLQWRQRLEDLSEITALDHEHAPLGSYDLGDEIYIQGRAGWIDDIGAWYRITGISIKPEDSSASTLQVLRSDRNPG